MTERPVPFPTDSPEFVLPNTLSLGQLTICLDHPDFLLGYQEGVKQYDQWHSQERAIETATLLFLVRNGWGDHQHSVFWQTGYIVGWLRALFAHAYNLGEVLE